MFPDIYKPTVNTKGKEKSMTKNDWVSTRKVKEQGGKSLFLNFSILQNSHFKLEQLCIYW